MGSMYHSVIHYEETFVNTAVIEKTGATKYRWFVPITSSNRDNYGPFTSFTVTNNSGQRVIVRPDFDAVAGYSLSAGEKVNVTGLRYRFITVENTDATVDVPIGKVIVTVRNFDGGSL